jgi:hypothetical protein
MKVFIQKEKIIIVEKAQIIISLLGRKFDNIFLIFGFPLF